MKTKFLIVLSILASAVLTVENFTIEDEDRIVENYLQNFPKFRLGRYSRIKQIRQNILKRYYQIQEHNIRYRRGEETFEMELNELSALGDENLAETRLGFSEDENASGDAEYPEVHLNETVTVALPDYWNWADHGIVQPVQDQGSCGSCYAFAAIGVIESSMCRFHGKCVKLSEQEAMECTRGCNGGWDTYVYTYADSSGGCAAFSHYNYFGYVKNQCDPQSRMRVASSQSHNYVILPKNSESIRQFLFEKGPLFVAFDVYTNFFSYRRGILTTISGTKAGGHAVLLVGYGTSNGIPYWILKNSWGTRWGENGYFRVIRGVDYARIESWKVSFAWTK